MLREVTLTEHVTRFGEFKSWPYLKDNFNRSGMLCQDETIYNLGKIS